MADAYLLRLKWPAGFSCPRCGGGKYWFISGRHRYQCAPCGRQSSLTAGTMMEGTKKPLEGPVEADESCVGGREEFVTGFCRRDQAVRGGAG